MCRNIRILVNFEPPSTEEEMRAAALQYVRKVSGTSGRAPAKQNQEVFDEAVAKITAITKDLLERFEVRGAPRDRDEEKAKARERNEKRFGPRPMGAG